MLHFSCLGTMSTILPYKTEAAIILASIIIGTSIYLGMTHNRRAFMEACIKQAIQMGNDKAMAEYVCGNQFKGS